MKKLLMKLKMVLSKLLNPRILLSTNLHIPRILSFETKRVPKEQFQRNDVWDLVPKPKHKNIIGTK